jgi:hypothetical protein
MDGKVKAALAVLGLDGHGKLPKFKHITKTYHKLAMLHHPDRPGVDGEYLVKYLKNIEMLEIRIYPLILRKKLLVRLSIIFSHPK